MEKWMKWSENKAITQIWMPGGQTPNQMLDLLKDRKKAKKVLDVSKELSDNYMKLVSGYEHSFVFQLSQLLTRVRESQGTVSCMTTKNLPNALRTPEVSAYCLAPTDDRINNFITPANIKNIFQYLLAERKHLHSNGNDISAVLLLVYDKFKLLFGGDTTYSNIMEGITLLMKHPEVCSHQNFEADFVKVAHHGSKYSSDVEIWENILPENSEAVLLAISAGDHKKFEHPDQETLDHIHQTANKKKAKIGIYSTNGKGDHPHQSIPVDEIQVKWTEGISVGEMRVKWPDGKKNWEVGNSLDNNPSSLGLVTPGQFDPSSNTLLGYCFEFDPDNVLEPIRVMRVLPESAIFVPK